MKQHAQDTTLRRVELDYEARHSGSAFTAHGELFLAAMGCNVPQETAAGQAVKLQESVYKGPC